MSGPLETKYKMTASPMDHQKDASYIDGFNHALRLADDAAISDRAELITTLASAILALENIAAFDESNRLPKLHGQELRQRKQLMDKAHVIAPTSVATCTTFAELLATNTVITHKGH